MKFEFKGKEYPIKISYWEAITVLPEKFGISLTKVFTDGDAATETMQNLVLDDEKTLELAWFYIEPTAAFDKEDFYKQITGKDLEQFREDFWSAVVNFSGPLKKNLLMEIWTEFRKELKAAKLDLQELESVRQTLNASPSDSNQEA